MSSRRHHSFLAALSTGALVTGAASAQTLITDNFEVDSSADYTLVDDGVPDGSQIWAFDYTALSIPPAPRSAAGETSGVVFTANDAGGVADHWTAFHNTAVTADSYRLTVDVWMNFVGASGTTEYSHIGVGGDGATFNSVFTPISGSGAFLAFTGDGGSSSSDYRWFRDAANTPAGDADSTTLPNSHPSYLGHGSRESDPFFQDLFPAPPSTIPGSPSNIWTTVQIDVDNINGVISFRFDGVLTYQGGFDGRLDGLVSIGLCDVFSSISLPTNFTIYDNLLVEEGAFTIGDNYCDAVPNSTGNPSTISATGSVLVARNNVTLRTSDLPNQAFGYYLTSMTQGFTMMPGGSVGNLCLDGSIGRYVGPGQVQNAGGVGSFELAIDLNAHPTPVGLVAVMPGETWNFTTWHRDNVGGTATSNFSNGLRVVFQ
ncbi:MAG: hypothetical protein AAGB93_03160 [Planctomycetota bacterium]